MNTQAARVGICVVLLLMVVGTVGGSSPAEADARDYSEFPVLFDRVTDDERLNALDVAGIAQDARGFMWFGIHEGDGGLTRFDGYETVVYRHDEFDDTSLSDNEVWVLHVDAEDTLWVGTMLGCLNRYNRDTDDFTRFRYDPEDESSLPGDDVKAIYTTSDGTVWVATTEGLARYEPTTESFERFFDGSPLADMPLLNVRSIVEEPGTGRLWLGTRNVGLIHFDPSTGEYRRFSYRRRDPGSISHHSVDAVHYDRAGNLWLGTRNGLNRFDAATGTFDR